MITWGNLDTATRETLRNRALGEISDDELARRFSRDDAGEVSFRLAGALDEIESDSYTLGPVPPAEVWLIAPDEFDYDIQLSDEDAAAAEPIDAAIADLRGYFAIDADVLEVEAAPATDSPLPPVVDHRSRQSPIKAQGNRSTCVSHAALALLEAAPHIPEDLSEQYAHYLFTELTHGRHDRDSGLRTTDAAGFLARPDGRVCLEQEWPYEGEPAIVAQAVAAGTYGPPPEALAGRRYGYGSYKLIPDTGLEGEASRTRASSSHCWHLDWTS